MKYIHDLSGGIPLYAEYVTDSDVVFVTGGNSFSLTKICSALSSQYTITV